MDWWITFDQQAADYLPDLRIEKEEPMDRHTSFRIGGPARRMAFPERGAGPAHGFSGAGRAAGAAAGHGRPLRRPSPGDGQRNQPAGPGRGAGPAGDRHLRRPEPSGGRRDTGDHSGGGGGLPGPGGGFRLPAGAGGPGIRPRHPGHGGRRGVHECRRLRRGDGPGGAGGNPAAAGGGHPDPHRGGDGLRLPPQLSDGSPGCGGAAGGVLPDARRPGGNPGPDEGAAGKAQGQPAAGVPQRGQHLQAAGGLLRRAPT